MDRSDEFNEILLEKQNSYQIPSEPRFKKGKSSLLLTKKPKGSKEEWTSLTRGLKDLVEKITEMRNKLITNRRDYINLYGPLAPVPSRMTDFDRNRIDYDVHDFMKRCNGKLKEFKEKLNSKANSGPKQTVEHFNLVLFLVQAYLKSVSNIYTEQKAIRTRRAFERQKLSRLAAAFKNSPSLTLSSNETFSAASSSLVPSSRATSKPVVLPNESQTHRQTESHYQGDSSPGHYEDDDNYLSPEEIQILKKENNVLYDEINAVNEEVESLTSKVEEISRLQGIFAENILGQEEGLSSLSTTMISATENTREGNDEIREAIKKGAGFRVWVLFAIITLAFTILFLDWYNP